MRNWQSFPRPTERSWLGLAPALMAKLERTERDLCYAGLRLDTLPSMPVGSVRLDRPVQRDARSRHLIL